MTGTVQQFQETRKAAQFLKVQHYLIAPSIAKWHGRGVISLTMIAMCVADAGACDRERHLDHCVKCPLDDYCEREQHQRQNA